MKFNGITLTGGQRNFRQQLLEDNVDQRSVRVG